MSTSSVRLAGNISEISRAGLYSDSRERVTVSVEGAEPLYAELRLPNERLRTFAPAATASSTAFAVVASETSAPEASSHSNEVGLAGLVFAPIW